MVFVAKYIGENRIAALVVISPIAMPATGLLHGTPAFMSDIEDEHTVAIEEEPFDSSTSATTRMV